MSINTSLGWTLKEYLLESSGMDEKQFQVVLHLGPRRQVRATLMFTPHQLVFRVWPQVPYGVLEEFFAPAHGGPALRVDRARIGHIHSDRGANMSYFKLATRSNGLTIVGFSPANERDADQIQILLYIWRLVNRA